MTAIITAVMILFKKGDDEEMIMTYYVKYYDMSVCFRKERVKERASEWKRDR